MFVTKIIKHKLCVNLFMQRNDSNTLFLTDIIN